MIDSFTDGNSFLDSYLKNKEYVYVTSITHEYTDITKNWYESLKRIGSENFALVIALDQKSYINMLQYNIPCVYLESNIKSNNTYQEWLENEKHTKVIGPYYIAEKYNIDIIHSEVDIVFLKDPIQKLKEEISNGYDMLVLSDKRFDDFYPNRKQGIASHVDNGKINTFGETYQKKYGVENFGFSYMPMTPKIFEFWKDLNPKSNFIKNFPSGDESGHLQTILINKLKNFDIKFKTLSCFEFANGSIWANKQLKQSVKDKAYLIHYNFSDDELKFKRDGKINAMKQNGHWYID
jgi:hypothetical protein